MRVLVYLRWFFVLSLFTACTSNEPPVGITEAEPPATQAPEAHLDVNSLTGKIVYSSEGDVYVINADGSERRRLTDNPAEDFDPVWSPDGTQIAFRSHRDGNEEVYLMQADGSEQSNLSSAPGTDYSPAWSPDGQWIAFNSDRTGHGSIWIIKPDGSGLRQATDILESRNIPRGRLTVAALPSTVPLAASFRMVPATLKSVLLISMAQN